MLFPAGFFPLVVRPGLQAVITASVRFVQRHAAGCGPFAAADEKTDIVEPAEGIDSVTDTAAEDAAFSVGIFPCQRNVRVDARKLVLVTVRDMNGMMCGRPPGDIVKLHVVKNGHQYLRVGARALPHAGECFCYFHVETAGRFQQSAYSVVGFPVVMLYGQFSADNEDFDFF